MSNPLVCNGMTSHISSVAHFASMSLAAFRTAVKNVIIPCFHLRHPTRRSSIDAVRRLVKRRIPRSNHIWSTNLLAIHDGNNTIDTQSYRVRISRRGGEPMFATLPRSLEQMRITIHRISHPFRVRIPRSTIIALEIGIICSIHLPVETFLNSIILRRQALHTLLIPLLATPFGRCVQIMFG